VLLLLLLLSFQLPELQVLQQTKSFLAGWHSLAARIELLPQLAAGGCSC
jgi:hypothetical protein